MKNVKAIFLMMFAVAGMGISQAYACKSPAAAALGLKSAVNYQTGPADKALVLEAGYSGDTTLRAFSRRDLDGRYASYATATFYDPTANRTANATCIGVVTFDGRGHFTDKEVHSYDGVIVRDQFTGTYTVNADGTGKMHFVGESETYDYEFVISNDGKLLTYLVMLEIPGIVSQGTLKKQ